MQELSFLLPRAAGLEAQRPYFKILLKRDYRSRERIKIFMNKDFSGSKYEPPLFYFLVLG
jgi:hypothetical protein